MAEVLEWPGARRVRVVPAGRAVTPPEASGPLHVLRLWMERAAVRRELRTMSDDLLRDCGLDPVQARDEADRPFFRPLDLERARLPR